MRECTLLARTAALALSAIFVLPSCFTFNLWRAGNRTNGPIVDFATAPASPAAGPAPIVCRLQGNAGSPFGAKPQELNELCAQWQPPLAPGDWIAIEPLEHAEAVARLWRDHPSNCGLQVVRNTGAAAPRGLFVYPKLPENHVDDELDGLPGLHVRPGPYGSGALVFEAECRIAPTAAPPHAPTESPLLMLRLCDPPTGTWERVLTTPLALALDTVLLPFELIGLPVWW